MARGNPAMKAKRVTGPTPNNEMLTRLREQELKAGGTLRWHPITGKRRVVAAFDPEPIADPNAVVAVIHNEHYH